MAASKFTTAPQKIARALTQTECVGAWHQNGRKDDQMPQHFEQNTTGVRPDTASAVDHTFIDSRV